MESLGIWAVRKVSCGFLTAFLSAECVRAAFQPLCPAPNGAWGVHRDSHLPEHSYGMKCGLTWDLMAFLTHDTSNHYQNVEELEAHVYLTIFPDSYIN